MSRIASLIAVADDTERDLISLPKWGVTIEVRGLDGNLRSEFQEKLSETRDDEGNAPISAVEKTLLVQSCFDPEDGEPCFSESDIEMLWTKSGAYISKLVNTAMKVSGLRKEDEDELGKSSSGSATAIPSDASTSTSPSN